MSILSSSLFIIASSTLQKACKISQQSWMTNTWAKVRIDKMYKTMLRQQVRVKIPHLLDSSLSLNHPIYFCCREQEIVVFRDLKKAKNWKRSKFVEDALFIWLSISHRLNKTQTFDVKDRGPVDVRPLGPPLWTHF